MYDIETFRPTASVTWDLARFASTHGRRQRFARDVQRGHLPHPIWLARHEGIVVGFVEAQPMMAPYRRTDWAHQAGCEAWTWVHNIFVTSEHRRNAVGSRLLLEPLAEGLRAGVTFIALSEAPGPRDSDARRGFFKASGLRLVDEEHAVWLGQTRHVRDSIQQVLAVAEDGALAPPAGGAPAEPAP
jgi:GNAT superfamily N-acetyltransferase